VAQSYSEINGQFQEFVMKQHIFFVATAGGEGKVNLSPKGMDSLRIVDPNRVVWLNLTGSGNETSAHVQENGRMTLMFCAFEGKPSIVRFYGHARVIHPRDAAWPELITLFPEMAGSRQLFDMSVEMVLRSCGMAVPYFDFVSDRRQLLDANIRKGEDGIAKYWAEKNQSSLDGKPTNILG